MVKERADGGGPISQMPTPFVNLTCLGPRSSASSRQPGQATVEL